MHLLTAFFFPMHRHAERNGGLINDGIEICFIGFKIWQLQRLQHVSYNTLILIKPFSDHFLFCEQGRWHLLRDRSYQVFHQGIKVISQTKHSDLQQLRKEMATELPPVFSLMFPITSLIPQAMTSSDYQCGNQCCLTLVILESRSPFIYFHIYLIYLFYFLFITKSKTILYIKINQGKENLVCSFCLLSFCIISLFH